MTELILFLLHVKHFSPKAMKKGRITDNMNPTVSQLKYF